MSDPLLTAEDVATMLGMGADWVYAQTRAGRIPHVKLGRYRRYRRESIEDWIAGLESATVAAPSKRGGTAPTVRPMAQEECTS